MGSKVSKAAHGATNLTQGLTEEDRKLFIGDMTIFKVVAVAAIALAVILPLVTLSWFALIGSVPLALIGYEVFQIASNAQEVAEKSALRIELKATGRDDFREQITKRTLLLKTVFAIFPGFADLAVKHMRDDTLEFRGIRSNYRSN